MAKARPVSANMMAKGCVRGLQHAECQQRYPKRLISVSTGAGLDATNVTAEVLTKHLDVGLTLLADIVLNPTFAESEIDRLRKQTMAGLMQQKDDPGTIADLQYSQYLFGEHPYGQRW